MTAYLNPEAPAIKMFDKYLSAKGMQGITNNFKAKVLDMKGPLSLPWGGRIRTIKIIINKLYKQY
ncbi:hypothetical protein LLG07_05350 [bacterium]|nr:hypothetical protein [bacterium]